MSKINWLSGASGLWTDGTGWSGGVVPGAGDFVAIAAPPALTGHGYTVELDAAQGGDATQIGRLAINQAFASLEVNSTTLAVSSAISLAAGTLTLRGGTLQGGNAASSTGSAIVTASGGFTVDLARSGGEGNVNAGSISDVVWHGTMNLFAPPGAFAFRSHATLQSVTFAGLNGTGAGVLNAGPGVAVYLNTSDGSAETLSNVNVLLQSGASLNDDQAGLTLAANTVLTMAGFTSITTTTFDSAGRISVDAAATSVAIGAASFGSSLTAFSNSGTISLASGASVVIDAVSASNTGLISLHSGSYLRIGDASPATFSNTGSIAVAGGTLSLELALTTAQVAAYAITNGTFGIAGTLTNTGATLTSGMAGADAANLLLDGGTIIGGTIVNTGHFMVGSHSGLGSLPSAGTLSGVTYDGNLTLAGTSLTVENGFTLAGLTAGSTPTLSLTGGSSLTLIGSQVLDNTAILLDGTLQAGSFGEPTGTTLTLGSKTVLTVAGSNAALSTVTGSDIIINEGSIQDVAQGGSLNGGMDNVGQILVANSSAISALSSNTGTVTIGAGNNTIAGPSADGVGPPLLNAGLITDTLAGSTLTITGGVDNTGTIAVAGATLAIDGKGLANTGSISVTNGTLLTSRVTTSQLASFHLVNSGVDILGALTIDTGKPLLIGKGTSLPAVKVSALVTGGTIIDSGNGLQLYGASTFSNITYQGTLTLDRPLTTLTIDNAFAASSAGGGAGIINLTGAGSALVWDSTQVFDNAILSIGNASLSYAGHAVAAPALLSEISATGSLGAHLIIQQAGAYADIGGVPATGGFNANSGGIDPTQGSFNSTATIKAGVAHGHMSIEGLSFTNAGTLAISSTDTVTAGATAFVNSGLITVASGATLNLDAYNYFASGTFADQAFTNGGTIALAGGTLSELAGAGFAPPALLNTGTLQGAGILASTVVNDGTIAASGGTLTDTQAVTGAGTLLVAAGATLLLGAVGQGQTASFSGNSGVLGLAPLAFHGKVGTFAAGDTIDLAKTSGKAASFSGSSIVVTLTNGGTITLSTTSALTGTLTAALDGHGGTLIQFAGAAMVPFAAGAVPEPSSVQPEGRGWSGLAHADASVAWAGPHFAHALQS